MKEAVVVILMVLLSSACRHTAAPSTPLARADDALHVSPEIHDTKRVGWTVFSTFVAMNIPFEPVVALKKELERREGMILQSRGEAHITIIAPTELAVLKTRLSLGQINGLAEKMDVQSIPFQIKCLGRAQGKQGSERLSTYFLVLDAPGLAEVRERLRQQFILAGGSRQAFATNGWQPHITVGFTKRDLFENDGVNKDSRSCLYRVE